MTLHNIFVLEGPRHVILPAIFHDSFLKISPLLWYILDLTGVTPNNITV